MPQAPKALARTGLDTLGTGALSNLNSTGAHTARIGSRRPSTDLCSESIEPHPTTTAFSVPGHSRSSRPGEFREGGGRPWKSGSNFHCRASRTPPKLPSIFFVCEAVRALRQKSAPEGVDSEPHSPDFPSRAFMLERSSSTRARRSGESTRRSRIPAEKGRLADPRITRAEVLA